MTNQDQKPEPKTTTRNHKSEGRGRGRGQRADRWKESLSSLRYHIHSVFLRNRVSRSEYQRIHPRSSRGGRQITALSPRPLFDRLWIDDDNPMMAVRVAFAVWVYSRSVIQALTGTTPLLCTALHCTPRWTGPTSKILTQQRLSKHQLTAVIKVTRERLMEI